MEQPTKIVSVAALPQVRVLGRTTGTDVVNLFWTGSGIEFIYTGSEIQVEVNADFDAYEPWLAVELNGVQAGEIIGKLLQKGFVAGTAAGNVLRLLPPLTVSEHEVDMALEVLAEVLGTMEPTAPKEQA